MRVAFTLIGGKHWLGGQNYLLNLLRILQAYAADAVTPILFTGDDVDDCELEAFREFLQEPVIKTPLLGSSRRLRRALLPILLGKDPAVERLFQRQGVELVFENAIYYGWGFRVPVLAWIPDVQHRRLPGMFSFSGYWKRELGFRAQVGSGRTIMVSSESARKDCENFYPASRGHVQVVPFAVMANGANDVDPDLTRRHYGLPEHFFYLPNQFWKHKNHQAVIDAVSLLKKRGVEVVVAASGQSVDQRHPEFYRHLNRTVAEAAIADNFRFIGMVPYRDLLGLMKSSAAVINPSLFEGWSTTVEEAKALGVPLILSDIDVHREQAASAEFFDPADPAGLAEILARWNATGKARTTGAVTLQDMPKKFAENFARVAMLARQSWLSRNQA
jgi:glycosyltransferase involved in cell wall biosynthesis